MAIVYDHAVKYNGKYYPPNVPIVENKKVDTAVKTTKTARSKKEK